jgi:hypothetical protein
MREVSMADNGKLGQVQISAGSNRSTMSSAAILTVIGTGKPPHVVSQPKGVTGNPGKKVTLKVKGWVSQDKKATKGLKYQWFKNGTPISGATKTTLKLGKLSAETEGQYHVVLTNPSGLTAQSDTAVVSLNGTDNLTISVRFRPKRVKPKTLGSKVKGVCLVKGKPRKAWKALAGTAEYHFTVGGQDVAVQTGKKGKRYRHILTQEDDGLDYTCSVIVNGETYDASSSVTLQVKD